MYNLGYQECKNRGKFDFPIELYHVDSTHPRYEMPLHWHIDYEFIRILSGSLTLILNAETLTLNKNDIVLIQDGMLHGGKPNDCIYECIDVNLGEFLKENKTYKNEFEDLHNHQIILNNIFLYNSEEYKILQNLFENIRKKDRGYELIVKGLLFQFIGLLFKNQQYKIPNDYDKSSFKKIRQLKKCLNLIREKYNTPLNLEDLSKACNMSPKYFCRFFQGMTGKTPIDYLNYYRVECACEQLLYSDENVTEIALNCGFNDLSYFIKTFKKYKGITPVKFRKNNIHLNR